MRISEALSRSSNIEVMFEAGAVLHVTYRPVSYSLRELDEMEAVTVQKGGTAEQRKERLERVAGMIGKLVISWDLESDDGVVLDPTDIEAMKDIPSNVFTEILSAVKAHQSVGEAARPSDAG
jgi:hypothetical protein